MSGIPDLVAQTAANQGVDPMLALAVASAESNFDPEAVSRVGAIGVMQLMPPTAAQLGVDPRDAAQNIQGGISYLGQLLSEFGGDYAAALAAYNWGPGNVKNAISHYGSEWLSSAPGETRSYVSRILASLSSAPAPELSITDEDGNVISAPPSELSRSVPYILLAAAGAGALWIFS